jgi:uncharacterized protein with LGFP repeats
MGVSRWGRRVRAWRPGNRLPRSVVVLLAALSGLAVAGAVTLAVFVRGTGHHASAARATHPVAARPAAHTAPEPHVLPRSTWLKDAAHHQPPPRYDDRVVAVFVHHTDSPNDYDCADAPGIIQSLYAGQTDNRHWDDIGYNFVVDRCGTIYEGRAGGVDRPVTGAHTQGFNHRTAGIAALGTFTAGVDVPKAMTDSIAAIAAWKLGESDVDPRSEAHLVSSNSLSRYPKGTRAALPALSGHNEGYATTCPGVALSVRLPEVRRLAAHLQGRD